MGGQHHAPVTLPSLKTRYPLYRRLGGPQGRSGRVRKISPPPGFDPRIVQPVASRYTDWATQPTKIGLNNNLITNSSYTKFLGFMMDFTLSWNNNIEYSLLHN
jgi:hypothetical protein